MLTTKKILHTKSLDIFGFLVRISAFLNDPISELMNVTEVFFRLLCIKRAIEELISYIDVLNHGIRLKRVARE